MKDHEANLDHHVEVTVASASQRVPIRRHGPCGDRAAMLLAEALGQSADRAASLLASLGGLLGLSRASEAELVATGVPRARGRSVRAAFELARMSIGECPRVGARIRYASDVWQHMRARIGGLAVEEFWAIALDVRNRVIADTAIARGSLAGVEVHPRDVFRMLIKIGAAAVLFCHNHPSGDPTPSRQDIELTARLREVGELCGIAVLDHVVVATDGFVSISQRNWR
jgi:DNA repair protein RadC